MTDDVVVRFPAQSSGNQTRLSVNINKQTRDDLSDVIARDGIGITEAVRRIVPIGAFIWRAMRDGHSVQLVKDGKHQAVTFDV